MTRALIHYAALPIRMVEGIPQVLLITSRETRRWILPKGRPKAKMPARNVAAQEAYEEAGVAGHVSVKPIGEFPSIKRLRSGQVVPIRVRVYLLDVKTELEEWPEKTERERHWVPAREAPLVISEPGLADFLAHFASLWV
ncbi:MAG: NUDIX hydrolase [Alphaproteobacteria bacterium]|nr:NUDIX hydrolase [Alphaproteobacteria bacterium]